MMFHEFHDLLSRKVRHLPPVQWTSVQFPAWYPSFLSCSYSNLLLLGELSSLFRVVLGLLQFRVSFSAPGWKTDNLVTDNPWSGDCPRNGAYGLKVTEKGLSLETSTLKDRKSQVTPSDPCFSIFLLREGRDQFQKLKVPRDLEGCCYFEGRMTPEDKGTSIPKRKVKGHIPENPVWIQTRSQAGSLELIMEGSESK